jgi:hypothetical protein
MIYTFYTIIDSEIPGASERIFQHLNTCVSEQKSDIYLSIILELVIEQVDLL